MDYTKKGAWLVCLVALMALVACGGDASQQGAGQDGQGGKEDSGGVESSLCVGVRGNGARIFAHFGAMARIHEQYGLIDGVAGGSSASITSFLTESIYTNPHVFRCQEGACQEQESALRVALLFKSLQGYVGFLSTTEEAAAIGQLAPLVGKIQASGVGALLEQGDTEGAQQALLALLRSDDLKSLINPELIELITQSPDPAYHVQDTWSALSSFGSFATDSEMIFLRPGLLSFEALADKIGRIGSFYAAYGPEDAEAWQGFLDRCAPQSAGKTWVEISQLDGGDGLTCGDRFQSLLSGWRTELLKDEASHHSRIDDPIGEVLPSLISTSVLTGDASQMFRQARADYLQGQPVTWQVDFKDVRFGYWGQSDDLDRVLSNPQGFQDAKTEKFLALGEATWRTALSYSPAEPGLTRALEIDDQWVSAGGWSDLAPSLVLKNMGCQEVILVTRQGAVQGGFGPSVAKLLGMDGQQDDALYDLKGDSAVYSSLSQADGVWCTNWDGYRETQINEVFQDAYSAPLETQDKRFTSASQPYEGITEGVSLPGCSPGVE